MVRTTGDPLASSAAIRQAIHEVEPVLPIFGLDTMEQLVSDSLAKRRFIMFLLSLFAGTSFVLAGIGIYGVLSYMVHQRFHEIGIRMALGAERYDILSMVVREGMMPVLLGVGAGLVGAFALARTLESLLFQTEPTDPLTFVGVVMLLGLVALSASYVPARRATRIEPLIALRHE